MGTDHIPKTHSFSARSNVTERDTVSTAHYCACLFVSLIHCKRGHVLPQAGYNGKASRLCSGGSNAQVNLFRAYFSTTTWRYREELHVFVTYALDTATSRHACFTPGEKAPSIHNIGRRTRLDIREKRNICCTWPELNHESSVVQPVAQLFSSSWYRNKKEHTMQICWIRKYRRQCVFPLHIPLASNSFARLSLPETGNISLPPVSLFLSLLQDDSRQQFEGWKKSSN